MSKAKVYFTKEITSESLIKIYEALGRELKGKTYVKLSSGGHYFLNPNLIKNLVTKLNGTIVEGLTAYGGKRMHLKDAWQAIEDHGFKAIAPCDILDEEGKHLHGSSSQLKEESIYMDMTLLVHILRITILH